MGFSFVEQEESPGVLRRECVLFYNALETCVIKSPTEGAKVFGNDKDGHPLSGNGRDVIVKAEETPVHILYKSSPDAQEQSIGTIVWENKPNITP